jgi:hypothetical protein
MDYTEIPFDFLVKLAELDHSAMDEIVRRMESDVVLGKSKMLKYSEDQERDDHGRFSGGGTNPAMTKNQYDTVHEYTRDGYRNLNETLREGNREEVKDALESEQVKNLDALIATHSLAKDTVVYRGVKLNDDQRWSYGNYTDWNYVNVGDILQDEGYTSTAKSYSEAEKFMSFGGHFGQPIMFKITVPAGSPALDVNAAMKDYESKNGSSLFYPYESEILLPRQTRLEVTDKSTDDNGRLVINAKISPIPSKSLKYSEDQERDDHGRFASNGSSRLNEYDGKFKAAGGTIESKVVKTAQDSRSEQAKVERLRQKVIDAWSVAEQGSEKEKQLHTVMQGYRMMSHALDPQSDYSSNSAVLIAKNDTGKIAGALSYYAPEDYPQLTVQFLGTNHEVAGTGTALMREAMQVALDTNKTFAVLDPLEEARPWYESLGLGPIITKFDSLGGRKELYEVQPDKLKEILGTKTKSLKYSEDQERDDHGRFASGSSSSQFTDDEQGAISTYTDQDGYSLVNRYMRGDLDKEANGNNWIGKTAQDLQSAIDKAPRTDRNLVLYRGVSSHRFGQLRKGDVFTDDGFSSFSKDSGIASEFATGEAISARRSGLMFELELPAGSKALDVSANGGSQNEKEMLLPSGSTFEVMSDPETVDISNEENDFNNAMPLVQIRLVPPTKSFKYSEDQERDDHGRFAAGPGTADARASITHTREEGGATIPVSQGEGGRLSTHLAEQPTKGFAVATGIAGHIVPEKDFFDRTKGVALIDKFLADNASHFANAANHLGLWWNKEDGKVYLDITEVFDESKRAEAISAGQNRNQISIWDIRNKEEIPTGGTGELANAKATGRTEGSRYFKVVSRGAKESRRIAIRRNG